MQIEVKNLTFTYSPKSPYAFTALKDISLTIPEGEFFGIIGHTGSGKSTFIQHLNGLLKPTSGKVLVGNYDIGYKKTKFKELRAKVGMVFQYPEQQLFAETVEKDVAFGLLNLRGKKEKIAQDEIDRKVKAALTAVGLNYEEVRAKSPFELSGGQKRRAAIAGVIVTTPEILVLDEPCAGLDPVGKREIIKLLHSLHETIKTIIMVSHDMDEIARNCTTVALFNKGSIERISSPRELFLEVELLEKLSLDAPITVKVLKESKCRNINALTEEAFVREVMQNVK